MPKTSKIDKANVTLEVPTETTEEADLKLNKVQVTEEDKEQFLKCLLANKPFVKEYSLFNNNLKVKLKTLNVEETRRVQEQIQIDEADGYAKNDEKYFMEVANYRLSYSLVSVDDVDFEKLVKKVEFENEGEDENAHLRVKERVKVFNDWTSFKLSGVFDAYSDFQKLIVELTQNSKNPNFWIATA